MARKLKTLGLIAAVLIVLSGGLGSAFAETEEAAGTGAGSVFWSNILDALLYTVILGIAGLVILLIGYRILDLATPFDMNKEISEGKNVAAGALAAGMLVAVAIVIHAAMAL